MPKMQTQKPTDALLQRISKQALHARQTQKRSYLQKKWWSKAYLNQNFFLEILMMGFVEFQ